MQFSTGSLFLLATISCVYGGFNSNFQNNGFGGFNQDSDDFFSQNRQKFGSSGGNAAAAGNAGALGNGMATSINQANHQANRHMTSSSGLSANTAEGFAPQASGAAQAGGSLNFGQSDQTNFGHRNSFQQFRRKRQAFGYNPYFGGMGSNSGANSIGGGSAMDGFVNTQNMANSWTSPYGRAGGFAAGSANGGGLGVNIFNAANSNSNSFGGR